ncbi:MAG: MMPL family transporter [Clostridia bacterium]|nr:MMPL family transporter [Clostridia bacterium]
MIDKISYFIAKHPKTIFIVATILLIPSFFGYISTFVNYDIMSYLPSSIESVQGEDMLDKEFGLAANAFLVIDDMSAKDVVKVKNEIARIEGVSNVTWVDDIADISIPQSMLPDALTDIFYANEGKSTLLMIQFEQGSATTSTMNAIREIRTKLNKQCFLSGMSAIITDTKDLSDSEAPKYIVIAVVLALIALSFTMDSWVLPLVLLTALGYAVIYNLGTNIVMPNGISYITQSVAAILQLGVTMDYSVFLMDRFNEEQKNTDDKTEAMARAVSSTFISLTGSSLTTIFGFLALCFMSLTLGFDIGIVMAKGVVFGVITVVVVLPAFLLMFYKPIYRFRHKRIIPSFRHLNKFVIRHRKLIAIIFIALIVPSYIAKSAVPLDYVISNALPEQLDSVQALNKLKGDFNMATTHFVIIDDGVPSGKVSEMIDEFEAVDGVSGIISLNSFVGPAISENMLPDAIKEICFKNGKQLMMVNSVYTPSSDEENEQVDILTGIMKKYDPDGYLTGEGAMSKDLITVTDKDFKVTSIISIAAIFLLIAIIFKSISVPILLVAGIELAIFINLALSLVTGTNVSFIAPTIISCVQLGATVDYAILMTTRFREELRNGHNKLEAMQIAAEASDKSIFQSALVFFCATFGVYCVCNIEIVKSICSMLARGALVSGLVIIIFLPALLTCFERIIGKTTHGWNTAENDKKDGKKGEKKQMKSSPAIKKALALGTALSMLLSLAACGAKTDAQDTTDKSNEVIAEQPVYTAKPGSVSKAETVYINIDNSGDIDNISVTDWLHTDKGEVCVSDTSDLKNIENIKGDTLPVSDKDGIRWNMTDTDLYYSGETDKKPPVSIEINYTLDGKKIAPDKLAGKSGKVKIDVNMKNNLSKKYKIGGKEYKIYLPVLVVGGFIMPEAEFSGVQVKNGRAIGDGTKEIAVMFGVPGLTESLGLKEAGLDEITGIELGSTASVTADAKNFALGNMYFAAVPISSLNLELDAGSSVDDLKSVLSVLGEVQNTIGNMDIDKLVNLLTSGKGTESLLGIMGDAVELYNSNKALINVLAKYASPENNEQLKKLLEFMTDSNTAKAIGLLSDSSVAKFFAGLSDLGGAIPLADSLLKDLQDPEVKKAIDNLPATLEKIGELQKLLEDNSDTIDYLMTFFNEDTVGAVSKIVSMLDEADMAKLQEKYGSLTESAGEIAERIEKWIEFGKSYKIFTSAPDDMTTSVFFVYMTPSIEKKQAQNTQTATQPSGESPLDEFIKKFK